MQQSLSFEEDFDAASTDWRLDEVTKETGRRGIAQARRTLESVLEPAA